MIEKPYAEIVGCQRLTSFQKNFPNPNQDVNTLFLIVRIFLPYFIDSTVYNLCSNLDSFGSLYRSVARSNLKAHEASQLHEAYSLLLNPNSDISLEYSAAIEKLSPNALSVLINQLQFLFSLTFNFDWHSE